MDMSQLTGLNLKRRLSEKSIFYSTNNSFENIIRALENSSIDNTSTIAVLHDLQKVNSLIGGAGTANAEKKNAFPNGNRAGLNGLSSGIENSDGIKNLFLRISANSLQNVDLFSFSVEKKDNSETDTTKSGFNLVSQFDTSDNSAKPAKRRREP